MVSQETHAYPHEHSSPHTCAFVACQGCGASTPGGAYGAGRDDAPALSAKKHEEMKAMFDELDADKNGRISRTEIIKAMTKACGGEEPSEEDIMQVCRRRLARPAPPHATHTFGLPCCGSCWIASTRITTARWISTSLSPWPRGDYIYWPRASRTCLAPRIRTGPRGGSRRRWASSTCAPAERLQPEAPSSPF